VDRAARTQQAAMVSALLAVLGNALAMPGYWSVHAPGLREMQVIGMAVGAGALLVLWLRRARPSVALGSVLFLVVLLPTLVMVWLVDQARAFDGRHWVPYEPNKLSALTLAIIAPPGWVVGVTGILLFVGSALVHHLLLADVIQARMASGEPLGIIAYGAFALALLALRQRGRSLQIELARARAEKQMLERVAHLALLLRDLANTPTQTLELIRYELEVQGARAGVLAERMGRALQRLRRLNEILARYAAAVAWDKAGGASFDAEAEALALFEQRPGGPRRLRRWPTGRHRAVTEPKPGR
jgi:hypothetical protein